MVHPFLPTRRRPHKDDAMSLSRRGRPQKHAEEKPPLTFRYCLDCRTNTWWEYDYVIGHSCCRACNGWRCARPEFKAKTINRSGAP